MKILLALALLFSACAKHSSLSSIAPANSPTPPPEQTPDEFIAADIDRVTNLAGLARLKTAKVAPEDLEVRVWYGFGLVALEGFVINELRPSGAFHLKADHYSLRYTNRVARIQLNSPNPGGNNVGNGSRIPAF